ncbi:MAG: sigma-70 family RNA polymerase sigma factor [Acidobacteriota bacterium]
MAKETAPQKESSHETHSQPGLTQLLVDWRNGNRQALDAILPLVYAELRRIAIGRLRLERPGHTLQPTALVHEAYLRLIEQDRVDWKNRAQFFGIAAEMMRRILINHAVAKQAEKRGGDAVKVSLSVVDYVFHNQQDIDVLALDEAMKKLAVFDPRKSRIVELKFFGGLSIEEIAEVLEISHATVEREWAMARAWLYREITK